MPLSDKQIKQINHMDQVFQEINLGEMLSKMSDGVPKRTGTTTDKDAVKHKELEKALAELKTEINKKIDNKFEELQSLIEAQKQHRHEESKETEVKAEGEYFK